MRRTVNRQSAIGLPLCRFSIGKTDDGGAEPTEAARSPDDVSATIYRILGIDHHKEYHTPDGRPVLLVRDGAPIEGLLAG